MQNYGLSLHNQLIHGCGYLVVEQSVSYIAFKPEKMPSTVRHSPS